jgi:hypothetical protein
MSERERIDRRIDDSNRRVRDDSDELLDDVEELKRLEKIKRDYPISSPEFDYLEDRIVEKSREVFRLADEERASGKGPEPSTSTTTNEVEPAD